MNSYESLQMEDYINLQIMTLEYNANVNLKLAGNTMAPIVSLKS